MYYVSKRMEIAACHKLNLSYESKCANLHKDGMVMDFKHIKQKIHGYLDHGNLNELLPFNPTAENIAKWIVAQFPECYKAKVQESEGNIAVYCDDDKIDGKEAL